MPTLFIDGKEITVEKGTTLLQAAERLGIYIPRFCYHPALSIAGNCRMCLVEIEKAPKPVVACQTQCLEGMMILTNSERVQKLRSGVLEFLLLNHPLDCPVCDQSGECDLQNFYMKYGLHDSRLAENKVKKKKAVPVGKHVMLDSERCVLCGRCVRFTSEVTETFELGIFERGDRSELALSPGETLDQNPYSGNVADLCPVGALTDRDFRFKCRSWYLKSEDSICPGCSRGCNIRIDFNLDRPHHGAGERVMRLKPRENQEVNKWWLCDDGRYGYKFIDENRILAPFHKSEGRLTQLIWKDALQNFASVLEKFQNQKEKLGVLVSTHLTNEDLFALRKFFKNTLGFNLLDYRLPTPDGEADDILRTSDKTPNTRGAYEILKGSSLNGNEMILKARKGELKALVVFGFDLKEIYGEDTSGELRGELEHLIFVGSNWNGTTEYADLVLPSSVFAEKDGTFTNCDGRVQRLRRAFAPVGSAKSEWEILAALAGEMKKDFAYKDAEEILQALGAEVSGFYGMNFETVGSGGALLGRGVAKK